MPYTVSFSGLKVVFSKLSLAACIKNHVYSNFSLCYLMSSNLYKTFLSLQISNFRSLQISFINSYLEILQGELEIFQPFSEAATEGVP